MAINHKELAEKLMEVLTDYFVAAADGNQEIRKDDAIVVIQAEALLAIEAQLDRIATALEGKQVSINYTPHQMTDEQIQAILEGFGDQP